MNTETLIQREVPLQNLNSFGIAACAERFVHVQSLEQLRSIRQLVLGSDDLLNLQRFVLGGGSNVILPDRLPQLVLQMAILGRELIQETNDHYIVRAGAGENWHAFVEWTLQQGYPGLENLSLIPGTVGAAPIQNIGAYGAEMQDHFLSLTAFHFESGEIKTFSKKECAFAYRDSVFKSVSPNPYLILDVSFALPKLWYPSINYGDVALRLKDMGVTKAQPIDVSRAIVAIRQSKLPDPTIIGNAGSFFKNPIVSCAVKNRILESFPTCVSYPQTDGRYKLAAGWLIEQCGWKGRDCGAVGVYEKQALVLVNRGGATGEAVRAVANRIQSDVFDRFAVQLEIEPVFI
ncbi:MAG: UDP-N-acetylmuramate dehydrogenase [Burkholderiales bacterium]|nr:UDP-N-acetylmuramate dehydrogenase [Burkholderiales bacterium]